MLNENKGFDPAMINDMKDRLSSSGKSFILTEGDDQSDEFKHFYFVGMFEGKEVIYDAALYTLQLHHNSELYEIAEHRAAKHFPEYRSIHYDEDENGDLKALDDVEEEIGLFMAEVIMELEEEGEVKVHEFIDLDKNLDFGIGIDAALNVEAVTDEVVEKFIRDFNEDTLSLDETLYTFQTEDEEMVD